MTQYAPTMTIPPCYSVYVHCQVVCFCIVVVLKGGGLVGYKHDSELWEWWAGISALTYVCICHYITRHVTAQRDHSPHLSWIRTDILVPRINNVSLDYSRDFVLCSVLFEALHANDKLKLCTIIQYWFFAGNLKTETYAQTIINLHDRLLHCT